MMIMMRKLLHFGSNRNFEMDFHRVIRFHEIQCVCVVRLDLIALCTNVCLLFFNVNSIISPNWIGYLHTQREINNCYLRCTYTQ